MANTVDFVYFCKNGIKNILKVVSRNIAILNPASKTPTNGIKVLNISNFGTNVVVNPPILYSMIRNIDLNANHVNVRDIPITALLKNDRLLIPWMVSICLNEICCGNWSL